METSKFIDKSGKELKAGDLIVYGHALGRCAALQYGKVLVVRYVDQEVWNDKKQKHETVKTARIRVQGVDTNASWRGDEEVTLLKKGTLLYGDRTLKVTRSQIPAKVLALLDTVETETD